MHDGLSFYCNFSKHVLLTIVSLRNRSVPRKEECLCVAIVDVEVKNSAEIVIQRSRMISEEYNKENEAIPGQKGFDLFLKL